MTTPRRIVLAGASGLIGTALAAALTARGDTVIHLVRHPARSAGEITWDPARGHLPDDALTGADAVVNLAGAGVGDRRWTASYRDLILSSRVDTTSLLAERIAAQTGRGETAGSGAPPVLVQASATGYYGDRGDEVLREGSAPGEGFLTDVVLRWEAAAEPARVAGARVALVRSGIVLAESGGALGRLLPLLRLGVAGPLGSGRQYWSWITLPDEVRALEHVLDGDLSGPVNLTAPEPATNRDLTRALGAAFHRPAVVPVPAVALRLALGGFSSEILGSQRVLPAALEASGFTFTHPTVEAAAAWVAAGR